MIKIKPIGHVETCFDEKFGIPRQPGLVERAWGRLVFTEEFRDKEMLEGIDGFSHLWLTFQFHKHGEGQWKRKVRPPRLGGNTNVGVWASRSPFRPNQLGLSVVKLERVEWEGLRGPVLHLRGVDLVNGTPIIDIKPYVPYCDSIQEAEGGFATSAPDALQVELSQEVEQKAKQVGGEFVELVREVLKNDPRPQFHEDEGRVYGVLLSGRNVKFRIKNGVCYVEALE